MVSMKLIYAAIDLPSRWARSIQEAKMAQAFAGKVADFELVIPGDLWSLLRGKTFDLRQWYGLHREFKITRLPLFLKKEYPFPQNYETRQFILRFLRWATIYIRLRSPDLVYTRLVKMARAALRSGLTVLLEWHAPTNGGVFREQLFTDSNFLGVVAISPLSAQDFIENGLAPEKVLVEADGVDLQSFLPHQSKEDARHKLSLRADVPIVVYAGHLYDFKGIPTLYKVAASMPHCYFVLVGGWEHDIERARRFCQSNGLSNVHVVGFVTQSELPTYLYAGDILVLPNSRGHDWAETTSPLKLFEYMATRRPIVASTLPNVITVLRDMSNALLAEPDCPASFRALIERLLNEPQLGKAIAEQAFQDVQDYTWERRAERILQFVTNRLQEIGDSANESLIW